MSFAGTPLGQGRRLDHSTFLGKPPATGASALPSYAYSAPALGSRSPPKPRPESDDAQQQQGNSSADDPALVRFARLKQRESAAASVAAADKPGAPKLNTTPHPEKWSVKDTSVNIATAFIQAASGNASMSHNTAWASSSRQPQPRSTSVEYEQSLSDLHKARRLAPPPDKLGRGAPTVRKPVSKTGSIRHVPSSDGEEEHVRGKSPFETGLNMAKQALDAATFFVRARSREPENTSGEQPTTNGHVSGNESSYSYTQEEAAFQAAQKQRNLAKKGRMSTDNKAYKPSQDSEEESEYSDDGKTKRRRKTKKGPLGGPLNTLPVLSSDKRRKKRQGAKGNTTGGQEEEEEEDDVTETDILSQSMQMPPPSSRSSLVPVSRSSAQRQSREPDSRYDQSAASFTQGLDSIPEVAENLLNITVDPPTPVRQPSAQPIFPQRRPRSRSRSRTPAPPVSSRAPAAFSIGGLLGTIVRVVIQLGGSIVSFLASVMGMATFLFGQVFGTTFDLILRRPAAWARGAGSLAKLLVPLAVALGAWYVLQDASLASYIPSISLPGSHTPMYQVPATPPADISEVAERLVRIEKTLSSLSTDLERANARTQDTSKGYSDVLGRLGSLEGRISTEVRHVQDNEARARESVTRVVSAVKQEVDAIQSQIAVQQQQQQKQSQQKPAKAGPDEETAAKLRLMETRLSSAEGAARDALELGKKALEAVPTALPAPAPAQPAAGVGAGWWSKPAGAGGADGKDVPALIRELVDSAVSVMSKDAIGKPDFALYTSGARVVPRLTSRQMEVRPRGYVNQVVGLFTGKGQFGFLPPVSALHPDLHTGNCWPFAGQQGTLGVHLAVPAYIDEVTIDHVAKELALDMRTAPREMEVWGYVDGADNVARVVQWRAERAARLEAGEQDVGAEPAYPADLEPGFVRLAAFAYDTDAAGHIQTFPVDPEIRALGVDFGIVQLRVLGNWGRREYTCLYRFRVHGRQLHPPDLPFADEEMQDGADDS